jgi:hypothetical protein
MSMGKLSVFPMERTFPAYDVPHPEDIKWSGSILP